MAKLRKYVSEVGERLKEYIEGCKARFKEWQIDVTVASACVDFPQTEEEERRFREGIRKILTEEEGEEKGGEYKMSLSDKCVIENPEIGEALEQCPDFDENTGKCNVYDGGCRWVIEGVSLDMTVKWIQNCAALQTYKTNGQLPAEG